MSRLLSILSLLLPLPLAAQRFPNDGMHRYSLDFAITFSGTKALAKDFVDTIDIVVDADQIYLPVFIDGERYLFNLDTGSSQGIFYVGERLKYNKVVGKVNSRDANGHIDTIPAVEFPDFHIGHLHVSGYTGSLLRRPRGKYRYDAIIGYDLINKGLNAKIDIQTRKLILSDLRDYFDSEPGYTLRYKLRRFVPYVVLPLFPKLKEPVMIDLGSPEFFALNKAHFNQAREKDRTLGCFVVEETRGQVAMSVHGNERHGTITYLDIPRLKWAGFSFNGVSTATTQGDSRFGARLLNYGSLVFNPHRRTVKFQPFDHANEVSPTPPQDAISYVRAASGRAMVGSVRQSSVPYNRGFRQGDIILRINDTDIATLYDLQSYPFVIGHPYRFLLRTSQGTDKEVIIPHWGQ